MAFITFTEDNSNGSYRIRKLSDCNEFLTPFSPIYGAVTANGSAFGAAVEWDDKDEKTVIIVKNAATSAKSVTIKAGNGIQGVNDISVSVTAGYFTAIALDSGRFKNVSENEELKTLSGLDTVKGRVIITADSADISIGVIRLP